MKITTGVSLRAYKRGKLIVKTELIGEECESSCPEFTDILRPYLNGKGDVSIEFNDLDLSSYPPEVIRVYRVLKETVPPGRTVSYQDIARLVGKHPRFIGYCMKINRFPILIPCHRVVSKRGLGGFSYGKEIKRKLILFERKLFHR